MICPVCGSLSYKLDYENYQRDTLLDLPPATAYKFNCLDCGYSDCVYTPSQQESREVLMKLLEERLKSKTVRDAMREGLFSEDTKLPDLYRRFWKGNMKD